MATTNITLSRPELNTTKIEGFAVNSTNVTSDPTVTKRELSDLYWITSEMKVKSTGGNEKKVFLLDPVNTKQMNPDTGVVSQLVANGGKTFPATKTHASDADVSLLEINNSDNGYCRVSKHDKSNYIDIQFASFNPIVIKDVAYYNNGRDGLSAAILYSEEVQS